MEDLFATKDDILEGGQFRKSPVKVSGSDYACALISKAAGFLMTDFHDKNGRYPTEVELYEILKANYDKNIDLNQK
jgi:hypothetical protein